MAAEGLCLTMANHSGSVGERMGTDESKEKAYLLLNFKNTFLLNFFFLKEAISLPDFLQLLIKAANYCLYSLSSIDKANSISAKQKISFCIC